MCGGQTALATVDLHPASTTTSAVHLHSSTTAPTAAVATEVPVTAVMLAVAEGDAPVLLPAHTGFKTRVQVGYLLSPPGKKLITSLSYDLSVYFSISLPFCLSLSLHIYFILCISLDKVYLLNFLSTRIIISLIRASS